MQVQYIIRVHTRTYNMYIHIYTTYACECPNSSMAVHTYTMLQVYMYRGVCLLTLPQVVYSASHIDTIPDTLASSIASIASSVQQTYSTSTMQSISIPSLDQVMGGGGGMVAAGTGGTIPNSMLGQNEVATQIQGAMTGIQGSLMGQGGGAPAIQNAVLAQTDQGQGVGGGGGGNPASAQCAATATSNIQESIIAQSGAVGGDTIQDSIQDSILGQGGGGTAEIPGSLMAQNNTQPGIHGGILGQGTGQMGETGGMQDSNQYLNPAVMSGSPNVVANDTGASAPVGAASVADIASQLINQYVASSQPVPGGFHPPPATNSTAAMAAAQEPESMQTDPPPQPAVTAPTVNT